MSNSPGDLPAQDENNPFQKLALASLIAPVIAIAAFYALHKMPSSEGQSQFFRVVVIIAAALVPAGALFGIIALFGMIKYGSERILIPAVLGIAITFALVKYVELPAFRHARAHAAFQASLHAPSSPVMHLHGAHLLNDEHLHFSIDIPEGFNTSSDKALTNFNYCYSRNLVDNGYARVVVGIQQLDGIIPANQHLQPEDAAKQAPRGVKVDVVEKNWRGLKVDTLVSEQSQNGASTLIYVVQIPLAPSAIQLIVRGPASHRAEIEKLIDDMLGSVDGKSNWQ